MNKWSKIAVLRQRVITALVLAPLALWGILALPNRAFAALLGLIILLGAVEWSQIVGLRGTGRRALYVAAVAAGMGWLFTEMQGKPGVWLAVSAVALVWWFAGMAWVARFPGGSGLWRHSRTARGLAGFVVLLPAWVALAGLQASPGPEFVILLMLLVWGADTGAYFAGRRWGRRKLAPRVSPGKTWEGVGGGMALTLLVALVGGSWLVSAELLLPFVLLCLVTVGFSIVGDLLESMFKRLADIKDSGGLLPGHGGILDRIDSLTAAAPVFALGLYWLEISA